MDPVARRYALALYQEAEAQGVVEKTDDDVQVLRETLDGSRELVSLFESPVVSRDKKEAVAQKLFEDALGALAMRFVHLLFEKEREDLLPAVVHAYGALRDERLGLVQADVKTARPLGYDETQQLEKALAKRTGKQVRLRMEVDPDLIGGLVVRIGDQVYDRSVRHQLKTLREQLHHRAFLSQN
ncbi:MAG: F0F1 ATP synthase subunit delta [Rubricoccaceae bacterium]|nr:F0F1 ATP synthase subunit delta [Rubricoccaceae bacterium]